MKPLQNLDIFTHNTTIESRSIARQQGVYQNDSSGGSVASRKNYFLLKRFFDILFSVLILLLVIPRSTRYEWQHKPVMELFGHNWYCQNQHLFQTLQEVAVPSF